MSDKMRENEGATTICSGHLVRNRGGQDHSHEGSPPHPPLVIPDPPDPICLCDRAPILKPFFKGGGRGVSVKKEWRSSDFDEFERQLTQVVGAKCSAHFITLLITRFGGQRLSFPTPQQINKGRVIARVKEIVTVQNVVGVAEHFGLKIKKVIRILQGKLKT